MDFKRFARNNRRAAAGQKRLVVVRDGGRLRAVLKSTESDAKDFVARAKAAGFCVVTIL